MANEPENLILEMLRAMRAEIGDMRGNMATKNDLSELRSELNSLRADMASDLLATRKERGEQIVGLRLNITHRRSATAFRSANSRRACDASNSI